VSESLVEVTFALDDRNLDEYERQEFAKKLLKQLREQGDAESVERTDDLSSELGIKGGLVGVLTAKVPLDKVVSFVGFVGGKFAEKPIKIHVKDGDFEVNIEVTGEKAVLAAEKFVSGVLDKRKNDSDNG